MLLTAGVPERESLGAVGRAGLNRTEIAPDIAVHAAPALDPACLPRT